LDELKEQAVAIELTATSDICHQDVGVDEKQTLLRLSEENASHDDPHFVPRTPGQLPGLRTIFSCLGFILLSCFLVSEASLSIFGSAGFLRGIFITEYGAHPWQGFLLMCQANWLAYANIIQSGDRIHDTLLRTLGFDFVIQPALIMIVHLFMNKRLRLYQKALWMLALMIGGAVFTPFAVAPYIFTQIAWMSKLTRIFGAATALLGGILIAPWLFRHIGINDSTMDALLPLVMVSLAVYLMSTAIDRYRISTKQ
jgi:hypothetical protein